MYEAGGGARASGPADKAISGLVSSVDDAILRLAGYFCNRRPTFRNKCSRPTKPRVKPSYV